MKLILKLNSINTSARGVPPLLSNQTQLIISPLTPKGVELATPTTLLPPSPPLLSHSGRERGEREKEEEEEEKKDMKVEEEEEKRKKRKRKKERER